MYGIAHMWSLKINYANELTKQKKTHRLREQTYGCLGKDVRGRASWGVWNVTLKMDSHQEPAL